MATATPVGISPRRGDPDDLALRASDGATSHPFPLDPVAGPAAPAALDAGLLIDRDLSQLRFQQRVLEEAFDPGTPPLDRAKLLGVVGTNLDDFAMVRGPDIQKHPERRALAVAMAGELLRAVALHWRRQLVPTLARAGVHVVPYARLGGPEREVILDRFHSAVAPCLAIDSWEPGDPFPEVPSGALHLVAVARTRDGGLLRLIIGLREGTPLVLRAAVAPGSPVPQTQPYVCVPTDQVLRAHLADVLPGIVPLASYPFRVLRASDVPPHAGDPETARAAALFAPRRRATNPLVALIADRRMPAAVLDELCEGLDASPAIVSRVGTVTDPRLYWQISRVPRPDLRAPELASRPLPAARDASDLFEVIRRGPVLLHHPYDSFQPVMAFIERAAADPQVVEIALTLYRTERQSAIVRALAAAARRGTMVRAIVELNARADEARNASIAMELAGAGAQVCHAPEGLKVHAKLALVTRQEHGTLRRYAHISSGNYHAVTARSYTDLGLLTCDEGITADIGSLVDLLTGGPRPVRFRRLLVAPLTMREALLELVEREIAWRQRGEPAHLILKMNGLSDRDVMRLLCRAAQEGVRVDLLVRGICCLRPGVPGVSETITVRSLVGRFLQHSRAWWFRNGGTEDAYIGSADLMPRNLDRRVEVMAPLGDPRLVRRLRDQVLGAYLADTAKARLLRADGTYVYAVPGPGCPPVCSDTLLTNDGSGLS